MEKRIQRFFSKGTESAIITHSDTTDTMATWIQHIKEKFKAPLEVIPKRYSRGEFIVLQSTKDINELKRLCIGKRKFLGFYAKICASKYNVYLIV